MTAGVESKRVLAHPGAKFRRGEALKSQKASIRHDLPDLRAKGAWNLGGNLPASSRAAEFGEGRCVPLEAIGVFRRGVPGLDVQRSVIERGERLNGCGRRGPRLTIVNRGEAIDKTVAKL